MIVGRSTAGEKSSETSCYSLRSVTLDAADDTFFSEWRSFLGRHPSSSELQDPEWLRGYFDGQTKNIIVYSLYADDRLCGVAPFLMKDWSLKWQLGELTLARFPLTRFRFLGAALDLPEDEDAYDLLFGELAKCKLGFDAVYLEEMPVDSFGWRYLQHRPLIRKSFLCYQPQPPSPRPILRFQGSFKDYMAKFSSKHRKNLNREVKRLREGELGEMQFVRYQQPEEVSTFLDQAVEISRKTYQWTLHQRGLSDSDSLRKQLLFAAKNGWMRSYLLFCGGTAYAFLVGFQVRGRFLFHEIGFDPALAKYSIGTVMQLLAIEDMFDYDRPQILDLGDYGKYKEVLSTESYMQAKLFLFRRGAYAQFLRAGHRGVEFTNHTLASFFHRLNWKSRLKRWMRRWPSS